MRKNPRNGLGMCVVERVYSGNEHRVQIRALEQGMEHGKESQRNACSG